MTHRVNENIVGSTVTATNCSSGDRKPVYIIHVDDEPAFTQLIRSMTSYCNAKPKFRPLHSVAEAKHDLEQIPPDVTPDLILSDFDMQGASGLELLKWIRTSRFAAVPVVFISGSDDVRKVNATLQAGANAWIQKLPGQTLQQCAVQIRNFCGNRCGKDCRLLALFSSEVSSNKPA